MTEVTLDTEDAIQKHLDECPDDWQARMVLADLLDERHDPRAAGYRALGKRRLYAFTSKFSPHQPMLGFTHPHNDRAMRDFPHAVLPFAWYELLRTAPRENVYWHWYVSRASAEDAAALAYRPEFEEPTS